MSIWSRIAEAIQGLVSGQSLSDIFERLRTPPERSVAFTIAIIALGAKMAKADGRVTRDEVRAFRQIFAINEADEPAAAKVYDLARQDVAGFEIYADRIGKMFADKKDTLFDILEGLFQIAVADGEYHPAEEEFLREVCARMGLEPQQFAQLQARYAVGDAVCAYALLGVSPEDDMETIRKAYRQLVRVNHPDAMIARGEPLEAVEMATHRLSKINDAWETIRRGVAEPA
ncbi:TerB family tellurite resistance protein [Paracoccaceae bacterium GXU_MW_L88]